MTRLKFGLIVASLLFASTLSSCSRSDPSNSNAAGNAANQTSANSQKTSNDSAEELETLVQIPFEPEEVTWRQTETGGRKRIVAVLLLTADAHRLMTSKHTSTPVDVQVNVEQWFPVELITMGESSGEMTIAGRSFPANEFYQDPFNAGSVVFIPETNYVVLDLQSN